VGVHIANTPSVPNGHRVLTVDGRISAGFHWTDPADGRDPRAVLEAEDVVFDAHGCARPDQRITARELATLVGMNPEELPGVDSPPDDEATIGELEQRFLEQLGERDGPSVAGAVSRLLDHWRRTGGHTTFGTNQTTSCFIIMGSVPGGDDNIWPLVLYPGTTVEVVFQYLKTRPPFDDPALRSELRRRLNEAPDIDLPLAKLELRPSFPIAALVDPETWRVVADALTWFAETVMAHLAATASVGAD
jgi:hypothetical protein